MARTPKIVIVGGGTSGLAAAYTLRSKYGNKLEVVVLEAGDRAGGRIAGEEIDGFSIHTGASVFHESFETVRNLAESLGVPLKMSPRKKGGAHLPRWETLGHLFERFTKTEDDNHPDHPFFPSVNTQSNVAIDAAFRDVEGPEQRH